MGQIVFDNKKFDSKFDLTSFENIKQESLFGFRNSIYIDNIQDENIFKSYVDDSKIIQDLLNQTFEKNNFVSSEPWDFSITLQAKIVDFNTSTISCECLVDQENKTFELREFPIFLFSHLDVSSTEYVLIKLRQKPGSSRIDIFNGEKIIDKSIFEIDDLWDDLENSGLDGPFQLIDG